MMAKKEDSSERKSAIIERAIDLSIHRAFHFFSDRASLSIFMQRSQKRLSQIFATIRSHGKETSRKKPTVRYRRDRYRREGGVISSRVCLSVEKSLTGARARAHVPEMDGIMLRRSSHSCVDFAGHHARTGEMTTWDILKMTASLLEQLPENSLARFSQCAN